MRLNIRSVNAKFDLPHRPAPESLACEGPQYGRVLSEPYVYRAMIFDVLHKNPRRIGTGLRIMLDGNFGELCIGEVRHSPGPIGQARHSKDPPIVGYYASAARARTEEGLGHRDGAKRRAGTRCIGPGLSPLLEKFFDSRCLEGPRWGLT